MSRSARFLITALLLLAGSSARAQQANDGQPGTDPTLPLSPDPAAPSVQDPTLQPPPVAVPPSSSGSASAKPPSVQSISRSDVQSMAVQPPPEDSPFFMERQEAREAAANAGREGYGMYVPKPPRPPARQQIGDFFHDLFGHRKKGEQGGPAPLQLTVEPSDFSLSQTSEVDVSLRVSDASKHELEFIFPDNQRLEIEVKDSSGNIISRWSEDRAFDPKLGFTEINPSESIIFAERLPTAKMKAGQTYTLVASLANQQGYSISTTITPRP